MLATARALLGNPELILMDEPTEGLAPLLVKEMAEILMMMKEKGLSIVLVEQNLTFALELADHAHIMIKGRIVYDAPPGELKVDAEVKMRYLGV